MSARQSAAALADGEPRLSERQLFEIWRGQRFPAGALVTRQGVPVRVIWPGRPGRGPGPDFRGASIAAPSGQIVRGDIELHVRSSHFRAHGHGSDDAYRAVVLHVVFEDDSANGETPLPGGHSAPIVALAPWVARRADELRRWLERPLLWQEPCHDAVERLGAEGVALALEEEGMQRLRAKARRQAEAIDTDGVEQALYAGVLEALGYGGNAASMRRLAGAVRWDTPELEAGLFGAAGLLPSQRMHGGRLDAHALALEAAFARSEREVTPGLTWKLRGIRPENHPARRIAAAALLMQRLGRPAALLDALAAGSAREAVTPVLLPAEGYWRTHYDLCEGPCALPPGLIGRSRALEVIINAVLPVAMALGGEHRKRAEALLHQLPRPGAYGATKSLQAAISSRGDRIKMNAARSQGLLALHGDWCTQHGCGRCPLSRQG